MLPHFLIKSTPTCNEKERDKYYNLVAHKETKNCWIAMCKPENSIFCFNSSIFGHIPWSMQRFIGVGSYLFFTMMNMIFTEFLTSNFL